MSRKTWCQVVLASACLFYATGGVEASDLMGRSAQGGIVLNEVQYDPAPPGTESKYEWVELHNRGGGEIALTGWRIADLRAETVLPEASIPPGGFLVVAGEGFPELFPDFEGAIVTVGRIGNGLGNDGDLVRLLDPEGVEVDALSYGSDATAFDPSVPLVEAGHSLERVPAGLDTDVASDWVDQPAPSPGRAGTAERPTAVPTSVPPPTLAPGARVVLNEYLAAPRDIDWDGDGAAGPDDEWIELYNAGDTAVDLRGWQLDDVADAGSPPFILPDAPPLPARGHRAYFKNETGVSLNNGGDAVRLLTPGGTEVDVAEYKRSAPDLSWARDGDGSGPWVDGLVPSPGGPNREGGPPPVSTTSPPPDPTDPSGTPTSIATPTPIDTPDGSTPPLPSATLPTAEPTPGAPGSPTAAPTTPPPPTIVPPGTVPPPIFLPILVSEVLFDPIEAGLDAAHEWIELYNASDTPIALLGWEIGDSGAWDALPGAAVMPARGYLVIAATLDLAADLGDAGVSALAIGDGRIGNGLANGGDVVRLRGPTGADVDAVSWGSSLDAFDPAVPHGPPGSSVERLPSDLDTDSADDWWIQPAPSPGRQGEVHEGPSPLLISEIMPSPSNIDWDGDGEPGHLDEFIEIHNPAAFAIDLGRWVIADGETDGWEHRFERGDRLGSGAYRAVYRTTSGIALDNDADTVRLVRPDGVEADRFSWTDGPIYDRSWSRTDIGEDVGASDGSAETGSGAWSSVWAVTPGKPNRPLAPGEPHPADVAWEAKKAELGWTGRRGSNRTEKDVRFSVALADVGSIGRRTSVVVRGRVTAPPGVFGHREFYIGDENGGVKLYLRRADHKHPPFVLGDPVAAIGKIADFRGERQVVLDQPGDSWWDGVGGEVDAIPAGTGDVGEALEGRLIHLGGRVVNFSSVSFTLDDGSGPARVVVRPATGLKKPWVQRGEWRSVIGIIGQSAERAPWEGGYRVTPRFSADLDPPVMEAKAPGLPPRYVSVGAGGGPAPDGGARRRSRDGSRVSSGATASRQGSGFGVDFM